jgi:hypothetical protein
MGVRPEDLAAAVRVLNATLGASTASPTPMALHANPDLGISSGEADPSGLTPAQAALMALAAGPGSEGPGATATAGRALCIW